MYYGWSTLKKLIYLRPRLGGTPSESVTVTGISPLLLESALRKALQSLIQDGVIEQDGTPTPSAPVPIMCNNGALQMVHQSGLPSGYKLLEYVGGSGSQYVITDLYLASTDMIECEYCNSSTTGYGAIYGIYKTGESSALYGNQTYYGYDQGNNKVDTDVSVDTEWHSSRHDFVNGTLTIDNTTVTFTPWAFVNTTKNAVLSRFYNGSYGYNWRGYVRKFKVTRNGEVICDLLPAKNSSNVVGLYDLISGSFYTATGGTLLEGDEVDDYELRVIGSPETINITASGADTQTASAPDLYAVGNYADEVDIISGNIIRRCGITVIDGSESGWALSDSGTIHRFRGTKPSDARTPSGRAPIASTHFVYIGTGQAPGGAFIGASQYWYFIPTDQTIDTPEKWTAWLSQNPVIVIYPLDEEVAEQYTPQPITLTAGDNLVTVTAEVDNIPLEATYIKAI